MIAELEDLESVNEVFLDGGNISDGADGIVLGDEEDEDGA